MMGTKTVEPKLYLNFSLDDAVPGNHIVRRLASAVDFNFVHGWELSHGRGQACSAVCWFWLG